MSGELHHADYYVRCIAALSTSVYCDKLQWHFSRSRVVPAEIMPIPGHSVRKYVQSARPSRLNASGWYQLYFAAVTEGNERRAVVQIDRARRVMQDRLVELRSAKGADGGELQDLNNALTYLAILLQHVGREGRNLIWD